MLHYIVIFLFRLRSPPPIRCSYHLCLWRPRIKLAAPWAGLCSSFMHIFAFKTARWWFCVIVNNRAQITQGGTGSFRCFVSVQTMCEIWFQKPVILNRISYLKHCQARESGQAFHRDLEKELFLHKSFFFFLVFFAFNLSQQTCCALYKTAKW